VDNKGTGGGAAFYGVDAGDSFRIEGVGAESVDGFGGEGDEASGAEEGGGAGDVIGMDRWDGRRHRLL
jgi:hypothetical protein